MDAEKWSKQGTVNLCMAIVDQAQRDVKNYGKYKCFGSKVTDKEYQDAVHFLEWLKKDGVFLYQIVFPGKPRKGFGFSSGHMPEEDEFYRSF